MLFLVHCCFVDIAFTLSLLLLIHCCPYLPSFTPFSSTTLIPQLNPHIFHTQNIPCVEESELSFTFLEENNQNCCYLGPQLSGFLRLATIFGPRLSLFSRVVFIFSTALGSYTRQLSTSFTSLASFLLPFCLSNKLAVVIEIPES